MSEYFCNFAMFNGRIYYYEPFKIFAAVCQMAFRMVRWPHGAAMPHHIDVAVMVYIRMESRHNLSLVQRPDALRCQHSCSPCSSVAVDCFAQGMAAVSGYRTARYPAGSQFDV